MNELAGYSNRVSSMLQVLADIKSGRYVKTISKANEAVLSTFKGGHVLNSEFIQFINVPIVSPNGDVLVKNTNFVIKPGMHIIITGPNGCGKSSLFRLLGGLWPILDGTLLKPLNKKKIFYIPQRPYLCIGTLRDQIIYPDSVEDVKKKGLSDVDLLQIMEDCHLR